MGYIESARLEGATILAGGGRYVVRSLSRSLPRPVFMVCVCMYVRVLIWLKFSRCRCWWCFMYERICMCRPEGVSSGFYVRPTVITNVETHMKVWREEIFGPVLCVKTFKTEGEAIALANDTEYGLAGAVISKYVQYNLRRRHLHSRLYLHGEPRSPCWCTHGVRAQSSATRRVVNEWPPRFVPVSFGSTAHNQPFAKPHGA